MEADFSGWATKANLKCSDGRIIMPEAFAHMDGQQVPLVWQHGHGDVSNVLGHAILSAKPEGVWAEGFFNKSAPGQQAKELVQHKDVRAMSIYANGLIEKSKQVFHGMIREVSLVISGANPGAMIENIRIAHSYDDELQVLEDEAVITTGELIHSADGVPAPASTPAEPVETPTPTPAAAPVPVQDPEPKQDDESEKGENQNEGSDAQRVLETLNDEQQEVVHSLLTEALETSGSDKSVEDLIHAGGNQSVQQIFDSMSPEQKNVVYFMIGAAVDAAQIDNAASHSSTNSTEGDLTHQEGDNMSRNAFDQSNTAGTKPDGTPLPTLSHNDLETIQQNAQKMGSYKDALLAHADTLGYGIDDIEFLFPDAKSVTSQPDLIARRTEWVAKVIDGAKHSPFARVKSLAADLTAEEARAKGYVKGNLKKDEVIKLLRRVTTPTTVYKKQKLDRDDIVDITDLDVVAWLKWEMRFMLEEEIARAILIGDGREPDDDDKIDEACLRPIAWDDEMYAHPVTVPSNVSPEAIVESILRARKFYKGTGTPALYTTDDVLTDMILIKDKVNRRLYNTEAELAAALRVSEIVVVEVMEDTPDLLGVIVNMSDYTIGADKGGQLAMFDDFDIDYNQQKYLMETRISGALTKPKSAVVIKRTTGTTVTPQTPAFDEETNTITIPTVAGVTYYDTTDLDNDVVMTAGTHVITRTTDVEARPNTGNSFVHNTDADWTFAYTA